MVQALQTLGKAEHELNLWGDEVYVGHDWNDCVLGNLPSRWPSLAKHERSGIRRRARVYHARTEDSPESLRHRLDNANAHFRRKAAEVLDDEHALKYLDKLYRDVVIDIPDSELSQQELALAKLAAANFCEIGINAISITLSGRRFADSIGRR